MKTSGICRKRLSGDTAHRVYALRSVCALEREAEAAPGPA